MAVESLIGLAIFAAVMLLVAWYADKHRSIRNNKTIGDSHGFRSGNRPIIVKREKGESYPFNYRTPS